jgi:perosamine synthetase
MVTHFYGLACDIERISEICRRRGVPLIEDAAQAFGARVNGRPVGTFGSAGIYSFGMYKNVNSFLGGMLVTNSDVLKEKVSSELAQLPLQGTGELLQKVAQAARVDVATFPPLFRLAIFWLFRYAFLHDVDAVNNRLKIDLDPELKTQMPKDYLVRMTPLQARMILGQLDRVDRDAWRRIEAAKIYHRGLSDIPDIICPPLRDDFSHIYWYFPIQVEDRHALVGYAMKHGRDITESHHRNCAALPCFLHWYRDCPHARATADSLIYLPTYPRYTDAEIEKTVGVIRHFFGR